MNATRIVGLTNKESFGCEKRNLWLDLNPGSHRNQLPYFFNFRVRHGDAAIRPVSLAVKWSQKGKRFGQSMDHDCSAGPRARTARALLVSLAGIRDMKRQMELAMRVLGVDYVVSLGRFVIAFHALRADRHRSKRYFVDFEHLGAAQKRHGASGFHNDDPVGLSWSCRNATKRRNQQDQE